jgi:hypothetical protein
LLLLTNDDVELALTMADCVAVLRRFFEEEGKGQVLTRQRTESWLPHLTSDTFYQCKTMEGGVPYIGKYVIRIDSNVTRKKQHGLSTRQKQATSLTRLGGQYHCFLNDACRASKSSYRLR